MLRTRCGRTLRRFHLGYSDRARGVTGTLVFVLLVPAGIFGQQPESHDAAIYLAAQDFFRELAPVSVFSDYRCETQWMRRYGLAIRCRSSPFRTPLRLVAEAQHLPLVDEPARCGPHDEARSLELSPVQMDSADSAWFVVVEACIEAEPETRAVYRVQLGLRDSVWSVHTKTRLDDTGSGR